MNIKLASLNLAAACLALLFAAPVSLPATTITVTSTNDSGPGTLRDALTLAANGDTIDATGVSGTITLTNGQLLVSNSVTLLGPGPATLTVSGNHTSRVFDVAGSNVTISGLTIANGFDTVKGGGINAGGGPGTSVTISNCTISGNSASSGQGGGLYNSSSTLTVVASTLSRNYARDGAGIFNDGLSGSAVLTLNASTVSRNSADGRGGGIYNRGPSGSGTVTINASTLSSNSATFGGGIYNSNATVTINTSTFNGNSASLAAGGVYNDGHYIPATLTINASTFSSNSAGDGDAGAIYNDGYYGSPTVTINASTFSGNSGSYTGGILNECYSGNATVTLGDTILNAGSGNNIHNVWLGTITSAGYNLSSDGSGSSFLTATGDQNNTNPMLGPLQDNGGPTWTDALLPGSPAIDKGKTNAIPTLARNTDQRGLARPVDFADIPNASLGDGSDIGAFEAQQVILVTSTNDSGPGSLREALASATNGHIIDATGVSGTITLTNGQLEVAKSVTVLGPGPATLTVSGNHAGRVFDVTGTNVAISGLTIADGYGAGYGTGIKTYGAGTRLTVNNCVLTNNSTTLNGGGIFNDPGVTMIVSNSTLCGNSAPSGSGGGICNYQGTLTVANSTLSGNSANLGGGIYSDAASGPATLSVTASTLNNNSANYGAGIYNHGPSVAVATVTIVNSTFSANNSHDCIGNDGAWGGHVVLTIMASTFSGNSGVGIYNDGRFSGSATLELGDTILRPGSLEASIENADAAGTVKSDGYNLSSDNGGGCLTNTTDLVQTDPKLGPLQNNGGPTLTHALLAGSPAIDQGKRDAVAGLGLNTDQCGCLRPVNFLGIPNANGGDGSDIGAFEAQITQGSSPLVLTGAAKSGSGGPLQFSFTNAPGASFTVFTTTNLALPFSNWTVLGVPIEIAPGQIQFTDPQATNRPQGFYRVTSP